MNVVYIIILHLIPNLTETFMYVMLYVPVVSILRLITKNHTFARMDMMENIGR